jgi:hypothetical protein
MFRVIAAAIVACLFVPSAFGAEDEQQTARAKYAELAAKVRAGNLDIDWKALRVAAAIGEVGSGSTQFQAMKDGYSALNQGKFEESLKIGRGIEDHDIADVDAHYLAWRSLAELGRQGDAEEERILLADLLDSIQKSGDGKSVKTAWFAATIREEYLFMQAVLNVQFQAQRTWTEDGHYYDVVAVKDKDGKDVMLWFNCDTEMHRQTAAGDRALHKQ